MNYLEKTVILIPAYNEEKNIGKVLNNCTKFFTNIIVVDDGSNDETSNEINKFKSIINLRHCINCGQGTAIATGIKYFFTIQILII